MTVSGTEMISIINESASCIPSLCRTCCHRSCCGDIPSSEVKEHEECESFRRHEARKQFEEENLRLIREEEEDMLLSQQMDDDDD